MIVQRRGGMTEFIPSPREKREGLVRDHSFNLIEKLKRDESRNIAIHNELLSKE